MNLETFRKNVEANEVYKEKMPLVRIAIENQFVSYKKLEERTYEQEKMEYCCDVDKCDFDISEECVNFNTSWKNISIYDVIKLYSQMNWKIDDKVENVKLDRSIEGAGYNFYFQNLYEKIAQIESSIEFVYVVLVFTNFVWKNSVKYKFFVRGIFQYLKENELSELIKWTRIDNRKTVFVAMSFHESMQNARKKITEAVQSFGYEAMLIDIKEHNNQIVPEIFTEIKKSKFVVADLTGQRGGVYFEAGYAKALEKDLILCCKKEEQEKVHFDVAQINTIFWENENDLYERLRKRIESTIETETYF